jgi:NAD(P)-dependent dehydrogenase (short-subunit alcohol dehydrogenase family)
MSKAKLKPIEEQVIVITGASSGIGLATAMLAAKRGAKVVFSARSQETTSTIVEDINRSGGSAIFVPCDVANRAEVEQLARAAIDRFGRIDTWVNNAGVSIYGRLDEVSEQDSRRLFDTNFWGVYHGCLAALPHLKTQGGALINLGSEVSEAVVPLQGMYSASKHAVKGFTDALRVEIEEMDKAPVSITLIQPTATNTPFPQHARNYMDKEPKLPAPLDDPEDVAEAILAAATHPTRSKKVGAMSKVNTVTAKIAPKLGDKIAAKQADRQQYDESPRHPGGTLDRAGELVGATGRIHGTGGAD